MSKYQRKMNGDGTENPKYVDLLGEDKAFRFLDEEKKGFLKRLFGG